MSFYSTLSRRKKGFTLIELLTVIFILAVIISIIIPHLRRSIFRAHLSGCQSNLRNIASACSIYTAQDPGHFVPAQLTDVVPNYLKNIPTCPAADSDSYTSGYTVNADRSSFTIVCDSGSGDGNHSSLGLGPNQPYYTLAGGLGP